MIKTKVCMFVDGRLKAPGALVTLSPEAEALMLQNGTAEPLPGEPEPEAKAEKKAGGDPEAKADAAPEQKTEGEPEQKPEDKTEGEPEAKTEEAPDPAAVPSTQTNIRMGRRG